MTLFNKKPKEPKSLQADFQTAISATKYGKFHLLLILVIIPVASTVQFESTLISYIIPTAACHLNLNVTQKGLLNSMPFFGMVVTGFLWGFVVDTVGRRKVLWLGCLAQTFVTWGQGLSTNFAFLSFFKFLGGALTGGVYVALATYVLEFHSTELRGKIQMVSGMIYASANILVPMVSTFVLPLNLTFHLYTLDLHAWNLLVIMTSVNAILATIAFYFLPESPKFLMTMGKNEEALNVLRKVYRINTGNEEETYPIESLIEEISGESESTTNQKSWKEYLLSGWQQISPLFGQKYRVKLLLVCTVQAIIGSGIHILRAYLPQVFQAAHEYQISHNGTIPNFCNSLELLRTNSSHKEDEIVCVVNVENSSSVYLNSVIIACATMASFVMAGSIINAFKRKTLLTLLGIMGCISINGLYFSQNTATTLALSSVYLSSLGVAFEIFLTIVAVIFPTNLRAMAISFCLFVMRTFVVVGNNVLPVLVELGCVPPFISLGCVLLLAVLLSCLLPNTEKEDMK